MPDLKVDINKLIKELDKLGIDAKNAIKKGVIKTTNECKKKAKENCPVDTGMLRNSIHSEIRSKTNSEIEGEVSTNLEYAPYVEYGTGTAGLSTNKNKEIEVSHKADWSGQSAQPYMYPAFTETRDKLLPNIKSELDKIMKGSG